MTWKNRGEPFVTDQGAAQRQSNGPGDRIRVHIAGMEQFIYMDPEVIEHAADFFDDLQDAIDDGEFQAVSKRRMS